jgi:hypothetical protein
MQYALYNTRPQKGIQAYSRATSHYKTQRKQQPTPYQCILEDSSHDLAPPPLQR